MSIVPGGRLRRSDVSSAEVSACEVRHPWLKLLGPYGAHRLTAAASDQSQENAISFSPRMSWQPRKASIPNSPFESHVAETSQGMDSMRWSGHLEAPDIAHDALCVHLAADAGPGVDDEYRFLAPDPRFHRADRRTLAWQRAEVIKTGNDRAFSCAPAVGTLPKNVIAAGEQEHAFHLFTIPEQTSEREEAPQRY